ncbi:hypothetical protein ACFC5Z_15050 [Streptomyces sp. NPDC056004]|uniref:hypothetical protein n=1 Tax=Streptomyces sp. NPDC056004 TaxID=3345677 RepID=UPI0035D81BBD
MEDRARVLRTEAVIAVIVSAQVMADVPIDQVSGARWLDGEQHTRDRWRGMVSARQAHHTGR